MLLQKTAEIPLAQNQRKIRISQPAVFVKQVYQLREMQRFLIDHLEVLLRLLLRHYTVGQCLAEAGNGGDGGFQVMRNIRKHSLLAFAQLAMRLPAVMQLSGYLVKEIVYLLKFPRPGILNLRRVFFIRQTTQRLVQCLEILAQPPVGNQNKAADERYSIDHIDRLYQKLSLCRVQK